MRQRAITMLVALLASVSTWAKDNYEWGNYIASSFSVMNETAKTITIQSEEELALLADRVNLDQNLDGYKGWTITLGKDLDLEAHLWVITIGHEYSVYTTFNGTFDGAGHTISNVRFNGDEFGGYYGGLFGSIGTTATVRNLTISQSPMRTYCGGGIVGMNKGLVENCRVTSTVSVSAYGDNSEKLGLIVGINKGTVRGCVAEGTLSDSGKTGCSALGGIVGYNDGGTLQHNILTGTITTGSNTTDVGGIIGRTKGGTLTYNLYADTHAAQGYHTDVTAPTTNTYGAAFAYNVPTNQGAIIDYGNDPATVTTSYSISGINIYPNGMVVNAVFYHPDRSSHIVFSGGSGTATTPYLIDSESDWNDMARAYRLGYCEGDAFLQTSNFNVSTPVGTSTLRPFSGTYDAGGYAITLAFGSADSYVSDNFCAPFRNVADATIKGLVVSGHIYSSGSYAGAIIGNAHDGTITLSDCHVTATIHSNKNGEGMHGGFVGFVGYYTKLSFEGCRFAGSFIGSNTSAWGGFVGWRNGQGEAHLTRCLFSPAAIEVNQEGSNDFVRNGYSSADGIYCLSALGTGSQQGSMVYSLTCGTEGCSITMLNTISHTYPASGLAFSDSGFLIDDVIHCKTNGEIQLGISVPEGYDFTSVKASIGSLSGKAAPFTYSFRTADGVVTATLIPVTEPQGNGTDFSPFLISSATDWNQVAVRMIQGTKNYSGLRFALANDITISIPWGSETAFAGQLDGKFNGQCYKLTANITEVEESNSAPIREINGATIKNLTVKGTVVGRNQIAGLVGKVSGGTNLIENCHVSTEVTVSAEQNYTAPHAGGIVGYAETTGLTVRGCLFDGILSSEILNDSYAGAIVGWCTTNAATGITLKDCLEEGHYFGFQHSGYSLCENGSAQAIGYDNCYHQNNDWSEAVNAKTITSVKDDLTFVYAGTGTTYDVAGYTSYAKGFWRDGSYYGGKGDALSLEITIPDGYAINTISSTNGTITGSGNLYTLTLANEANAEISATYQAADWSSVGEGTEQSPYLIYNTMQFDKLSADVNGGADFEDKCFRIVADLAYDKTTNNYTPIGYYLSDNNQRQFKGTLDGAGHTISGINVTRTGNGNADDNVGLFGYSWTGNSSYSAVIKNLKLDDCSFTGYKYVAPVMGRNQGTLIENCHVGNGVTVATAMSSGAMYHGGIAGYLSQPGSVEGCTSAASVTAIVSPRGNDYTGPTIYEDNNYYGGIVGRNENSIVKNCLYLGSTVQGGQYVGAIIGQSKEGSQYQERNFYRGLMTYYGDDQSITHRASNVGIGAISNTPAPSDYTNGAMQGYRRISAPSRILLGQQQKTYGEGDYTGIVAYDYALFYDGAYYYKEPLPLSDTGNNSSVIENNQGDVDIVLSGRKLWKDNSWNTLCLPFSISSFAETPLEGAMVKTLTSATFDETSGTLTLDFSTNDLTTIEAGKPYIVKWGATSPNYVENPVFYNVTISSTSPTDIEGEAANFHGLYDAYNTNGADKTMLYLAADNMLYWPDAEMTIGAFRAFFQLKGITAGTPADAANGGRIIVLNFGDDSQISGIINVEHNTQPRDGWYDLSGRKLNSKPTRVGVYISNGKRVVVSK